MVTFSKSTNIAIFSLIQHGQGWKSLETSKEWTKTLVGGWPLTQVECENNKAVFHLTLIPLIQFKQAAGGTKRLDSRLFARYLDISKSMI